MKTINRIYKHGLFLLAAAVAGITLASCEKDEPDKYEVAGGTPTINYIRCLSSEVEGNNDSDDMHYTEGELVTSASPQSTLCLVGKNLRSVYELWFNDKQAILNTSYITDNTLIVDVPRSVPNEVTNKIYMITKSGETVEYDFKVIIPSPTISTMSNEYAAAGSTVTLSGNYIIDDPGTPLTIAFQDANGEPLYVDHETMDVDKDFTSVSFTVPEGAVEGPLTVTSIYGATETAFHYKDTRGILFEFDGVTGLGNHGWHDKTITSDETSLTGNFLQLGNGTISMTEAGGWNDDFSFEYWPGNWKDPEDYSDAGCQRLCDIADFSNWENKSIKFEMNIPSEYPWQAGAMQIVFANVSAVSYGNAGAKDIYGNTLGGCNNTYFRTSHEENPDECGLDIPRALYRPWTTTGSYDTGGEWVTVTLPISSSFVYNFDGASLGTPSFTEEDFASLLIFVVGGGVNGTECTPVIKIDNIRVVPNK